MFVWLAVNVDNQLLNVKKITSKIEQEINFENSCYTLPMHVSLKMTFYIPDERFNEVVESVLNFYKTLSPFIAEIKGIEIENTIVWIRLKENQFLNEIHDKLNQFLQKDFGVSLHEYDCDYKFHSTLFMGNNEEKITFAYDKVKDLKIPNKLVMNRFLVGNSQTGNLGTFSVFKEVIL